MIDLRFKKMTRQVKFIYRTKNQDIYPVRNLISMIACKQEISAKLMCLTKKTQMKTNLIQIEYLAN